MPDVFREGPYQFYFYSNEEGEPPHVHVKRDRLLCKFWLQPVRLSRPGRFRDHELRQIERIIREREDLILEAWHGMATSQTETQAGRATDVRLSDEALTVVLIDGRTLSVPLDWYPRLSHGTKAERECWEWLGEGEGIHWPDLDEHISVSGLLKGHRSGESQRSFKRWLEAKQEGRPLTLDALREHERQERGD